MWLLYLKLQFDVVCITGSDRSTFSVGQLASRSSISICDRQEPSQGKSNAEDFLSGLGINFDGDNIQNRWKARSQATTNYIRLNEQYGMTITWKSIDES